MDPKKQKVIKEAVALMGCGQLAQRMKVSEAVVVSWLEGSAEIGDKELLALSKVLLDWSGKQKF